MTSTVPLRHFGPQPSDQRNLFLLSALTPEQISPVTFATGTDHFVAFIAWDVTTAQTSSIAQVARALLDAGCVYFCCWGPGCERLHDIVDQEYVNDVLSVNDADSTIMTTWHANDSIDDALWFALNTAYPDDRFFESAKAVVAVCIGNHAWASRIASALADPETFSNQVLDAGGDAA